MLSNISFTFSFTSSPGMSFGGAGGVHMPPWFKKFVIFVYLHTNFLMLYIPPPP